MSATQTEHRPAAPEEIRAEGRETDRRLKKAEDLFTSQWGRLMESLVKGDLVPLLQQRGIEVEMTTQRVAARRNPSTSRSTSWRRTA